MMEKDLLIIPDSDFLDDQGDPFFMTGKSVVEQSLRNRIYEHNFLFTLIGERDPLNRKSVYEQIKLEVEEDLRVIPGTCDVTELNDFIKVTARSSGSESLYIEYELTNFNYGETVPVEKEPEPEPATNALLFNNNALLFNGNSLIFNG